MENAHLLSNLLLRRRMMYWWIPYSGLMLFLVGNGVFLGAFLDGTLFSRFISLFLTTVLLSIIFTAIGWLYIQIRLATEARAIERVLADHWACWPQFNTGEEWEEFAKLEYERGQRPSSSFASAIIMLLIVFVVIAVLCILFLGPELWFLYGLGFVLLIAVGCTVIVRKKDLQLNEFTFTQRLHRPPPQIYLSSQGLYDEDKGYTTFRGLTDTSFIASSKLQEYSSYRPQVMLNPASTAWPSTEWSQLHLWLTRHVSRYSYYSMRLTIYVPPGFEDHARQLVKRLQAK